MESLQSIPFIFGVTGHRDLRDGDVPRLEERVRSLFVKYQKDYPYTELIVISALAEGADMLVARVAKELGVTLHVLLPYQEEEYLKSFDDPHNIKAFKELMAYASRFEENSCVITYGTTKCYQSLGERIADTSNMLIALWNGKEVSEDNGGTAAIIRYQRDGFGDNIFDARDGNAIYIINTPRISDDTAMPNSCMAHTEYLGMMDETSYASAVAKLDEINAPMTKHIWTNKQKKKIAGNTSLLFKYKTYFDTLANDNQPIYQKYMTWVLILTWLGIFFLELMHSFSLVDEWKSWAGWLVLGYFGFLALAFVLYKTKMENGKLQEKFIYSRGLSEAIRIQSAWNAAGLNKRVSRYHLATQDNKFTWMRLIMKNMHYIDSSHYESAIEWVEGQTGYFRDRVPERKASEKKWHIIEETLLYSGIAMMFVILGLFAYETYTHVHLHFPFSWHGAVLLSGILLLTSNFIGRYVKIQGFKEEHHDYKEMLAVYEKAQKHLGLDGNGKVLEGADVDEVTKARIFTDLGKKALEENSRWIELHDSRRAKNGVE